MTDHVSCPDCGAPAEVVDRYTCDGSPGPVAHVATVCVADRSHNYVQIED